MTYKFHPAAEAEFLESVDYYESKVKGLGGVLIQEFVALAERISDSPKAWQIELPPDIRRAVLHRFSISIIYRVKLGFFEVLAVAHNRQRPAYWVNRTHSQ